MHYEDEIIAMSRSATHQHFGDYLHMNGTFQLVVYCQVSAKQLTATRREIFANSDDLAPETTSL